MFLDSPLSNIDFSYGKFGIPWNYEMTKLAREIKAGKKDVAHEDMVKLKDWTELQIGLAALQNADQITYGWRPSSWDPIFKYWNKARIFFVFGGNGSGKTTLGARITNYVALQIPECETFVFHENETLSVDIGQKYIQQTLPIEYMNVAVRDSAKMKGINFSVDYKQKSGFSSSVCIIPPLHPYQNRGSEINFRTYQQYLNSSQSVEGIKPNFIWCDEEPIHALFKTLLLRLSDKKAKIMITCTPINGHSTLVQEVIDGAETIETYKSEWLGIDVPLVQKSKKYDDCYLFYLPTELNPYVDFDVQKSILSGYTMTEKKTRAYGMPAPSGIGQFPKFSPTVHVIEPDKVPDEEVSIYHSVDPAGDKNWVMIWYKVDKAGDVYVYREWPDLANYGLWALPSSDRATNRFKGSAGPAQKNLGFGYEAWAQLIKDLENGEPVDERIIDSRFANKTVTRSDGTTDTIEAMAEHGIYFYPSRGDNNIRPGLQLINSYLDYKTELPVNKDNKPRLFISKDCGNLIDCMRNYSAKGGPDENYKDFIDVLRYGLQNEPVYLHSWKQRKSTAGYW